MQSNSLFSKLINSYNFGVFSSAFWAAIMYLEENLSSVWIEIIQIFLEMGLMLGTASEQHLKEMYYLF
jgi:hypothetical protein